MITQENIPYTADEIKAMVKTIEELRKKYKEALERASKLKVQNPFDTVGQMVENIFPELKESEDERTRKEIIRILKGESGYTSKENTDKYITWLEKQGEQKPTLPKWKYKKDHTPLLRDSIILNKYGCVAKSPSGAIVSDVWVLDYDELAKLPKEVLEKQGENKPAEDDKMRREILELVSISGIDYNQYEEIKDWLEKQADKDKLICELGEYKVKYTQKVLQEDLNKNTESQSQSKFKVRDWTVDVVGHFWRVTKVLSNHYELEGVDGVKSIPTRKYADEKYHLWTIDDAKKGDILVADGIWIVEFDKKMTDGCSRKEASILTSVVYDMDDDICTLGSHMFYNEIWPASKEDIDLFKKKRNEYLASNSHNESKFKVGDKV